MAHGTVFNVMWQPGREQSLRENWISVYVWLSSFTVHLNHNIVSQLYPNAK